MSKGRAPKLLNQTEYQALSEFRYQLRRYLRFMEEKAREAGQNPQQYQLLLAIKGLPAEVGPTIGALADRMQLNHNSLVELVDRCERRGLLRRARSGKDRRQVELVVTTEGDQVLGKLAAAGREELRTIGPLMAQSLQNLISSETRGRHGSGSSRGKKTQS